MTPHQSMVMSGGRVQARVDDRGQGSFGDVQGGSDVVVVGVVQEEVVEVIAVVVISNVVVVVVASWWVGSGKLEAGDQQQTARQRTESAHVYSLEPENLTSIGHG